MDGVKAHYDGIVGFPAWHAHHASRNHHRRSLGFLEGLTASGEAFGRANGLELAAWAE
jgi:hypothetical protein